MTYWSGLIRGEMNRFSLRSREDVGRLFGVAIFLSNDGLSFSLSSSLNSTQDSPRDSPCRIVMQHQEPDKLGRS